MSKNTGSSDIALRSKDITLVDIKSIKPNEKNRNKHSKEQIERLCEIIKYQGFRSPLIISNRTGILVSGHGRLQAAKKLGIKELPVTYQDFDSEEQEYAAGVSENSIAAWSELDLSGINLDIADLGPDFDVDLLGIDNFIIEPAELENTDTDAVSELSIEQNELVNKAWSEWCSEQLINISLLSQAKIFFQSVTPGALKIYFLRSLFLGAKFPRYVTTARQYHRMLCSGDGDNGSIVDLLGKIVDTPHVAERLRFALQEKPSFEKIASVCGVPMAGHKAPLDFPVELAKELYDEFATKGHVLDPCHGWGGRYIGFLLSNSISYVGVDASPLTSDSLKLIINDLSSYHNKESDLICSPFEDSILEDSHFDFAMTSPPYFDREQYLGGEQAHTRYKTYEDFISGFYTQLFLKTHKALKIHGHFAIQIGNQVYDLDKQAKRIAKQVGFNYVETRATSMTAVAAENDQEPSEIILIFKKVS